MGHLDHRTAEVAHVGLGRLAQSGPQPHAGPMGNDAGPVTVTSDSTATEVQAFDFARPGRLTRERARLIQVALDEVAREATDALRLWIDGIEVSAGEVEERAVGDLISGVADHAAVYLPNRAERALAITENDLATTLVMTLLGGPALDEPLERGLTPLETEVLDLVLLPLLECISRVLGLGPVEIEVHESDPKAVNFIDSRELMLGIPFTLSNEEFSGQLWVVLTPSSFQSFTMELERRQAGRRGTPRPVDRSRNERTVERVTVPVVCGFLPVRVPARELAVLQPGDVLRTGQSTARDLVFTVGDRPVFAARPGQRGLRLVAEVIAVLNATTPTGPLGGTP
jgi:flagellar motor switch protein FliM